MSTQLITPVAGRRSPVDRIRASLHDRRVGPAARARLAAAYESAVLEPAERRPLITARIPVQRAAVRAAEPELLEIAARLRAELAPREDGVHAARRLVGDGAGPFYTGSEPDGLKRAARDVLARL